MGRCCVGEGNSLRVVRSPKASGDSGKEKEEGYLNLPNDIKVILCLDLADRNSTLT